MIHIYGLCDPDSGELRYVGKAKDAEKRLRKHIDERVLARPVNKWVAKLIKQGKSPALKILAVVHDSEWEYWERELIAEFRKTHDLLNIADGGAVPACSKEQRRKNARRLNEIQKAKPEAWKRFIRAKQDCARLLAKFMKDGDYSLAYRLRFRMKLDYARDPELHASWANL